MIFSMLKRFTSLVEVVLKHILVNRRWYRKLCHPGAIAKSLGKMIGRPSPLFIFHPEGEVGEQFFASCVFPTCDLVVV